MSKFQFGKYSGQKVMAVFDEDAKYCLWFRDNVGGSTEIKKEINRYCAQEIRLSRVEKALADDTLALHHFEALYEGGEMTPKQGERYLVLLSAAVEAGIVAEE
jgi:hypothetical protein